MHERTAPTTVQIERRQKKPILKIDVLAAKTRFLSISMPYISWHMFVPMQGLKEPRPLGLG